MVQNKVGNHTFILLILWNRSMQSLILCTAAPTVIKEMRGLVWKALLVILVF